MTGGGILYDPSLEGALADALEQLRQDPTLRATLGEKGKAAVFARFSDDVMAQKTADLYRQFVGREVK